MSLFWIGPLMAALTIGIIAYAFTRPSILSAITGKNSAAYRDALVGVGTITGVSPTGTTLNDQPQVRIDFDVEGVDGKTFPSHAKMIVPLTELALLRPGVVLPVRYLPDRLDKVEVDRSNDPTVAQAAYDASMIRQGVTTKAKLDIASRGVAGQAVVRQLTVPGEIRSGNSKVVLDLVVTRSDGTTFETEVEKFVPPRSVQHIQVGRIIDVRDPPDDESEVVLLIPANA